MKYVYGCSVDHKHPRVEVVHGMTETPRLFCQVCGAVQQKVPQAFTWGHRPFDTLLNRLEERYQANKYRRSLNK